jgi:hypothetical protein
LYNQIVLGTHVCEPSGRTQGIVSIPAKAEFVKALVEKGYTLSEAIRET